MIEGFTPEELAESKKKTLLYNYNQCKAGIELYRRCSVNRVLDYIRAKKITDPERLDVLLSHCQNKLAGNLDGIELDLREEEA